MKDWSDHHITAEHLLRSSYRAASVGNFGEAAQFARQAQFEVECMAILLKAESDKKEMQT